MDTSKASIIHPTCVIDKSVIIGVDVLIHPYVVVEAGVVIEDGVEIFPNAYIGKEPKGAGALARKLQYDKKVIIGANSSIGPGAIIYYDVFIGCNTLIGDGASIREESRIGSRCVIGRYVTINYNTVIKDEVKVMDHTWLAGNMFIEERVFISGGVLTANDNALGGSGYDSSNIKGPTILKDAKIGVGAILLPNVVIGEASTVAAGAIVTKDVPSGVTVFGVPAIEK